MTSEKMTIGDNATAEMTTNTTPGSDTLQNETTVNGSRTGHRLNTDDEDDMSDLPELIDAHAATVISPQDAATPANGNQDRCDTAVANPVGNGSVSVKPDEWMDVVGSGQLRKKVVKPGKGIATRPVRGQQVTIRSRGTLKNGKEVDCHDRISFVLGEGDVVSAWDLCLSLMDLGEVAIVETGPRFAYGGAGRLPDVPPDAEVTYEVELLSVDAPPHPDSMTVNELSTAGDKKRLRGNELYSRKDYSGAINSYTKALKLLEAAKETQKEDASKQIVLDLKIKCYNNLAASQLKVEAYEPALKSCSNVLDLDPNNVKALFRMGKVLASQGDFEKAVKKMKEALSRQPASKLIHQELSRLTSRESQERSSQRQLYQRMVAEMADVTKGIPAKTSKKKWLYAAVSVSVIVVAVVVSTQGVKLIF